MVVEHVADVLEELHRLVVETPVAMERPVRVRLLQQREHRQQARTRKHAVNPGKWRGAHRNRALPSRGRGAGTWAGCVKKNPGNLLNEGKILEKCTHSPKTDHFAYRSSHGGIGVAAHLVGYSCLMHSCDSSHVCAYSGSVAYLWTFIGCEEHGTGLATFEGRISCLLASLPLYDARVRLLDAS